MSSNRWRRFTTDLLDCFAAELPPDAPNGVREELSALRARVIDRRKGESRKALERDMDALCESTPLLREAAGKLIMKRLEPALEQYVDVMTRAEKVMNQNDNVA